MATVGFASNCANYRRRARPGATPVWDRLRLLLSGQLLDLFGQGSGALGDGVGDLAARALASLRAAWASRRTTRSAGGGGLGGAG